LAQAGEFHLDSMVRYSHKFYFIPHTYDLTMFMMEHKGGLDDRLHRSLWYDVFPPSEDEFKFGRSPTLFPPDGFIQKQESKTWFICIPMVISVAQHESVGIGDDGILIWLWDSRIHLIGILLQILIMINRVVAVIGLFHFWNVMRGDAETYSIWWGKFIFPIPRIDSGSGFVDFDFIEMPLHCMLHGSGLNSFRNFSFGFHERRMEFGYDGQTIMIRVAQCQHGGSFLRLA
jgi:hypothetical protein